MALNINYRRATDSDKAFLLELRNSTMNEHLTASSMSISQEAHLQRIDYKYEEALIIEMHGVAIGLLKIEQNLHNIEIIQIQISPAYQNKGIGRAIIRTIIKEATSTHKTVSLSVLKTNKAQNLYLRLGFKIVQQNDSSYLMQCLM
ncbi:GNAT family N-acetyltransferase [Sphingobacterium tabacisoli]|uniref:GNAT family N-acetyltransferase n=1 Tax=Sphingobacterium tabacisoli TaxID=2044855 RepID=A0ABW5L3B3_9SPHI|nr:GNAT family N-acetyltransferase [Sphingobacterium tabacisoli]